MKLLPHPLTEQYVQEMESLSFCLQLYQTVEEVRWATCEIAERSRDVRLQELQNLDREDAQKMYARFCRVADAMIPAQNVSLQEREWVLKVAQNIRDRGEKFLRDVGLVA